MRPYSLMLIVAATLAGCTFPIGPSDTGISYVITNQCCFTVRVEMSTGSDILQVPNGESVEFQSIDRTPRETFVVTGPSGDSVDVSQGSESVRLVDDACASP